MSTDKKIALVTGASRGIGRAAALQLAHQGWHVVALARSQKALERLDDEIAAAGGAATLVAMDLGDLDAIDQLGAQLYERFGRLDGLVANAAVLGPITPIFQAAPSVMEQVVKVNLMANQRLVRALHPLLRAAPGARVVFLTSSVASAPRAYWGPYAISKAGVEALALTYAAEVEITPIRVNLYNPGATRTAMRAKAYPGEDPATLPTPDEVAAHMIALLGEDAPHGERAAFPRPANTP